MPRGIPNVKRDESQGMRYTTFHVPSQLNPKHMNTSYLKSEAQTIWARKPARSKAAADEPPPEGRRGAHVVVIHPGSRYLRVGRASDVTPVTVPNVIARKSINAPAPVFFRGILRPRDGRPRSLLSPPNGDESVVARGSDDPFEERIEVIQVSLRDRMRFYKLRVTPDAAIKAATFNEQLKPELIPEINDPFHVDWIHDIATEPYYVGEKALRIADPEKQGYTVRWPIIGSRFNTRDYLSTAMIIDDIETIFETSLQGSLGIGRRQYKDYSAVLVIPDYYDRSYVRDMIQLLLVRMGFKQLCVQQESLAATYGAGISSACVVDIGATTVSIACVDEGMVMPETRIYLNMGGDYITEFLYVLLDRICFPYGDIDLARSYDWNVMEELKSRLCTLTEENVALNLYDFVVRRPRRPAEKYGLRAYDEIILAPMCLFEPRVIDFEGLKQGGRLPQSSGISEDITQAMIISTQHLFAPRNLAALESSAVQGQDAPASGQQTPHTPAVTAQAIDVPSEAPAPAKSDVTSASDTPYEGEATSKAPTPPLPSSTAGADDGAPETTAPSPGTGEGAGTGSSGGFNLDIAFEASKLPMDVAIFNSARAAGGDEKIRKYLQAVLVVGGTALVPGISHALESRLQAIATPLVANMDKVQIIPPPKGVDTRVLVWKGAAVLGKMDGVSDLWMTATEWDLLGIRGLRERCFFL
ncbi:actin-like ATPase domain-containing protein [Multifurca ochricompacta]|uniref:Actin-like ATPase domain-containing protein n=1 Tax=Multifurca ochricompacta TaxID=376703 RepID=A0AAD4MA31_9AGAM|nr:actin-like ATPase domain-containing protein [Multifurca ochricompacta]